MRAVYGQHFIVDFDDLGNFIDCKINDQIFRLGELKRISSDWLAGSSDAAFKHPLYVKGESIWRNLDDSGHREEVHLLFRWCPTQAESAKYLP